MSLVISKTTNFKLADLTNVLPSAKLSDFLSAYSAYGADVILQLPVSSVFQNYPENNEQLSSAISSLSNFVLSEEADLTTDLYPCAAYVLPSSIGSKSYTPFTTYVCPYHRIKNEAEPLTAVCASFTRYRDLSDNIITAGMIVYADSFNNVKNTLSNEINQRQLASQYYLDHTSLENKALAISGDICLAKLVKDLYSDISALSSTISSFEIPLNQKLKTLQESNSNSPINLSNSLVPQITDEDLFATSTKTPTTIGINKRILAKDGKNMQDSVLTLIHDCICYSDCAAYSVCNCYGNCGCNY